MLSHFYFIRPGNRWELNPFIRKANRGKLDESSEIANFRLSR
jgi:hypothetical protein